MGIIAAWNALLGVENKAWKKGFQEARDEVAKTDKSYKGFLQTLKSEYGKSSALGQTLKLLAGGGAIAGIGLAAKEFGEFTSKIAEMSDAYRKGDLAGSEFAAGLAREIPILGNVVKGFDNIREAITGEKAAMDAELAIAKESEASWERQKKIMEEGKRIAGEWAQTIDQLQQELTLLYTPDAMKGIVKAEQDASNELGKLRKKYLEDSGLEDKDGNDGPLMKKKKELADAVKDQQTSKQLLDAAKKAADDAGLDDTDEESYAQQGLHDAMVKAQQDFDASTEKVSNLGAEYQKLTQNQIKAAAEFDKARGLAFPIEAVKIDAATSKKQGEDLMKAARAAATLFNQGIGGLFVKGAEVTGERVKAVLEQYARDREAANALRDSLKTPLDEFSEKMRDDKYLLGAGQIDQKTYLRAIQKEGQEARDKLMEQMKEGTNPGVKAEEVYGSRTVTSADVPQPLLDISKTAKDQLDRLDQIIKVIAGIKLGPGNRYTIPGTSF